MGERGEPFFLGRQMGMHSLTYHATAWRMYDYALFSWAPKYPHLFVPPLVCHEQVWVAFF